MQAVPPASQLSSSPLRAAIALAALAVVIGMLAGVATRSATAAGATRQHGYVTTNLALPATNTEATSYARDVDGDGDRENRFGQFFANLAAQGLDFQTATDAAIASGDLLMLHSLRTPSLANTRDAGWRVLYAEPTADPDLSGSGSFTVDSTAPSSVRLPARIADHHVRTAAGTIPLRLEILGAGIVTLKLKQGKVFATCSRRSCLEGRINGAITAEQVDTKLVPRLAELFTPIVTRDCPGTGPESCMSDSTGKSLQGLFDADDDLVITAAELRDNALIQGTLAPDLDLVKASGRPGHDGVEDALSAGFGFEAVRASF